MKKAAAVLALVLLPSIALADPITFDFRDPAIEAIDEVTSFSLTEDELTLTLTADPATYLEGAILRSVVLNQTAAAFGINVVDTTCGGDEDSTRVDGGCTGEAIKFKANADVYLQSLMVSSFGTTDVGTVVVGSSVLSITSTGLFSLGGLYVPAGSEWSVAYTAGNGFSVDELSVNVIPEPTTLSLVGFGLLGAALGRRRR